ncbi:MAG: hypothetical protein H6664_14665 [Ardenticatenaceae bacterium]|nr:hypothetical protein [Ardenticatenaceae bacterium]
MSLLSGGRQAGTAVPAAISIYSIPIDKSEKVVGVLDTISMPDWRGNYLAVKTCLWK